MSLEVLKKYNIKAKKALGQNFLVNDDIVEKIADAISVEGQNIVEVGPGYGALTQKLLNKKPKSLNLVELDRDMINILEKRISDNDLDISGVDFHINNIDVLKYEPLLASALQDKTLNFSSLKPSPPAPLPRGEGSYGYCVIANIPYYITSPILRHFLYDLENKPEKMLILMQKDVGEKILRDKSSVLGLLVAKKCNTKNILFVGKENFVPVPKVESSVILFETHGLYNDIDDEKFLKIIKIGFSAVRKKLVKNFVMGGYEKGYILEIFKKLGFHENIRGEDLDVEKWCELVKEINI